MDRLSAECQVGVLFCGSPCYFADGGLLMLFQPVLRFVCAGATIALAASNGYGAVLTFTPTQDTYIVGTGTTGSGDGHDDLELFMQDGGVTANGSAYVWMQYDLSAIPSGATITSAHLELNLIAMTDSSTNTMAIDGYTHSNATGTLTIDETTFNVNDYRGDGSTVGGLFNTPLGQAEINSVIGDFSGNTLIPNGATLNQYYSSEPATSVDLALLQSIADSDGNWIIQLYRGNITGTHTRTFADRESDGATTPRLVIEYIPEPSSISLALLAIGVSLIGVRGAGVRR
jgi:hypothetical protein